MARFQLGLLDEDPTTVARDAYEPMTAAPVAADRRDFSNKLPPPGDQGDFPSCVGWAVDYAYHSYEHFGNGALDTPKKQLSPSFLYNHIKVGSGKGRGSSFSVALAFIRDVGSVPFSRWPYYGGQTDELTPRPVDVDLRRNPQDEAVAKAHRLARPDVRRVAPDRLLAVLNEAVERPVLCSVAVYPDLFDLDDAGNRIYDTTAGDFEGSHAIVITGYDKQKEDGQGNRTFAYKILNSWGTGWGEGGYGWISKGLIERSDDLSPRFYVVIPAEEQPGPALEEGDGGGGSDEREEGLRQGFRFLREGDPRRAQRFFFAALGGDSPALPIAFANLGVSYHLLEDYKLALRYYDAALEINPKLRTTLINKSKTLEARASYDDAMLALDTAREVSESPGVVRRIAHLKRLIETGLP